MRDKPVISFPRIGNYHIPVKRLLHALLPDAEVVLPPPMTQRTLELGSGQSPDLVCAPFKFNMGNFQQALELGANVLLQTGMGCRFGYYGELQETILRDMGYDFDFVLLGRENAGLKKIYAILRGLGGRGGYLKFLRELLLTVESIRCMDRFEYLMRERMAFETEKGSFAKAHAQLLRAMEKVNTFRELYTVRRRLNVARIDYAPPESYLKIGLVGELFTTMEPYSNHYIERYLIERGISVSRMMNATFLLFEKKRLSPGGYLKYAIGANGRDSVAQAKMYAERGYDGVIHMKSFGCTPEINAMPALRNLASDCKIPILHLSFDTHTAQEGLRTRLEAFVDMIKKEVPL